MNTCRSCLLGNTSYEIFNRILNLKHKVGKLVDYDNDLGQGLTERGISSNLFIISLNVSNTEGIKKVVSALHLLNRPHKCACCLLGVGHYGNEKVRNAVIHCKFNLLGVDHDKLNLVGSRLVKHADKQCVNTYRFTHTGSTCNKKVGHLCQITKYRLTCNVASDTYDGLGLVAFKIGGLKKVAKSYNA